MISVSEKEFIENINKYLDQYNEDILIFKNGKVIKKLENVTNMYDELKYSYLKDKYNL